jgi:hypothetical protein
MNADQSIGVYSGVGRRPNTAYAAIATYVFIATYGRRALNNAHPPEIKLE